METKNKNRVNTILIIIVNIIMVLYYDANATTIPIKLPRLYYYNNQNLFDNLVSNRQE